MKEKYDIIFKHLVNLYRQYKKVVLALTNSFFIEDLLDMRDTPVITDLDIIRDQILGNYLEENFYIPDISDTMGNYTDGYFVNCCFFNKEFSLNDLNSVITEALEDEAKEAEETINK